MMWVELFILLACIVVGARIGGIALGTVAGVGLAIFVFVFGMPPGVTLPQIMAITIPSTIAALLIGALPVAWRGPKLADDPVYLERLASGSVRAPSAVPALDAASLRTARGSTLLFGAGIAAVVLIGLFPGLRPAYDVPVSGAVESDQVSMSAAIMIIMIALSGLMMMCFTVSPQAALKGTIMRSGVTAMICIIGLSWLGSSFFEGNRAVLVGGISDLVRLHPWMFAVSLFLMSFMLFSAAASVSILVPVGVALGMPAWQLIGFYPAAAGNFFLPTYGTLLAAVSFDGTGTTTVGTYLVNHSFMRPGLVTMVSATIIGLALSSVLLR